MLKAALLTLNILLGAQVISRIIRQFTQWIHKARNHSLCAVTKAELCLEDLALNQDNDLLNRSS